MNVPPDPADDPGTVECANCGTEVDTSEWYPVATAEGHSRIVAFCDESCREEWLLENGEE